MAVVIRTERLELRSLDEQAARALRRGTPPPGVEWMEGYPPPGALEMAEAAAAGERREPFTVFEVARRVDGRVIGGCGFSAPPDRAGAVEVGYALAPGASGRGYEREALEALIGFAFTHDDVACVRASAPAGDLATRRVFESVGMMNVGETEGRVEFEA